MGHKCRSALAGVAPVVSVVAGDAGAAEADAVVAGDVGLVGLGELQRRDEAVVHDVVDLRTNVQSSHVVACRIAEIVAENTGSGDGKEPGKHRTCLLISPSDRGGR